MAQHALGPYPFEVPDFITDVPVRNKPPLHAVNLIVAHQVSFDFTIILDHGDEETRQNIAGAFAQGLRAETYTVEPFSFQGNAFQLHRFAGIAERGGGVAEHYLGFAYGDLVHVGFNFVPPNDQADSLRYLALTMLAGAIVRRGAQHVG